MSDFKKAANSLPEEGELDALIADTNLLIESVYDMLERPRLSPSSPVIPMTGPRSHNSSDSSGQLGIASFNTPKSPRTPPTCSIRTTTMSTPSSREIDREIHRIDSFCQLLENNLRSVTMEQDQLVEKRLRLALPSSPQNKTKKRSPQNTPPRGSAQSTISVRSPTPVEVIDLSDSMYMPAPSRASGPLNVSDDVIIISPSDDEVVDLSTPTFCRNIARTRNNHYSRMPPIPDSNVNHTKYDNAIRRSLIASRRSTDAGRSSSRRSLSSLASTSTTNIGATKEQTNANNKETPNWVPGAHCDNLGGNENERTPFMCPVCMESCINNEPTSTKCGHVFCARCIREAIRLTHKCPMCNKKLKPNMMFRIYI
ncbi:uncharacterized protein LOC129236027 isoform X1 [Anastrepha obliqua]|uniref:uncharacterized protein LOC129236027 isoform X1 n=1 Tax=Anastrepha obliqua TaxID=95512 RepID=UPI00240909D8|nr:uncharacterized protein LOC129236027 isoform X1 [Anastrepha obliqua]